MLNNLIDRIKLCFRKEKELYSALYDILGFYPRNITFYKIALMHKSVGHRATEKELAVIEGGKGKGTKGKKGSAKVRGGKQAKGLGKRLNNERLEFLGDAILDAVVGDIVYQRFPGKPEGFLTNARSKMVQRETLGKLAQQMGISKLILSSGRNATHNSYIGGNAFEALVGAVYLDRGYDACQQFWKERVMVRFLNIDKVAYTEVNFKSKLLEWTQKNKVKISFRLEDQSQDKNGSPMFAYTVVLEGIDGCRSEGFSKKESQQHASEQTLRKLRSDSAFLDAVFAAKTERTKMEEMPVSVAPDVGQHNEDGLIIIQDVPEELSETEKDINELNLDDVTANPAEKTREDIIAEAEAEAYSNS